MIPQIFTEIFLYAKHYAGNRDPRFLGRCSAILSLIYSLIQQVFTEYLLQVSGTALCEGDTAEQDRDDPCFLRSYSL